MTQRHRLRWALLGAACIVTGGPAVADGDEEDPSPSGPDPIPGVALVRLSPGVQIDEFIAQCEADHAAMGLELSMLATLEGQATYCLGFDPTGLSDEELVQLELHLQNDYVDGLLVWGEFDYAAEAPEGVAAQGPGGDTGSVWFYTADGASLFPEQYASQTLGLGEAHQRSRGQGTVVAVLDTGVDAAHPLLSGRVAEGGFNFIGNNTDTSDTGDGLDSDGDGAIDELTGHGTFVASLIALTAPDAKILPIRVLNGDGLGDTWSVVKGIYHAIGRGVEVINLSLGSTHKSEAIEDAIEEAQSLGIVVVAAAGNLEIPDDPIPYYYPAAQDDEDGDDRVGVTATDDVDAKAEFSNWGDDFKITAPGASTLISDDPIDYDPSRSIIGALPGGDYAISEGTSFSTAFVSGAAAVVRAQHPEWPSTDSTAGAVVNVLTESAVDLDDEFGFEFDPDRRLDVAGAALLAPPAPTLGDLDNDGDVDVTDFLVLLANWDEVHSSADLDGSGRVGIADFLILLSNWG